MFELSTSKVVDVLSIEGRDFGDDSPLHVPAYEELVEVVSRAVDRLNISWPRERQRTTSLPGFAFFFLDLHNELFKSWKKPHCSSLANPLY